VFDPGLNGSEGLLKPLTALFDKPDF
jgi:hypothetical protein